MKKNTYDDFFVEEKEKKGKTTIKKKKSGIWKIILIVVLLIGILTALLYFWRVNEFEIMGADQISAEEIIQLMQVESEVSIFRFKPTQWKEKIEKNPRLIVENIDLKLPNKAVIQIKERQAYAVVQYAGQYVYIDEEGIVLSIVNTPDDASTLLVRGLSVSGYATGEAIGVRDEYQLFALQEIMQMLKETGQRGWYILVDVTNPVDINLRTKDETLVRVGSVQNIEKKLHSASAVLNKLETEGKKGGLLDAIQINMVSYKGREIEASSNESNEEIIVTEAPVGSATISDVTPTPEITQSAPTQTPKEVSDESIAENEVSEEIFDAIPSE